MSRIVPHKPNRCPTFNLLRSHDHKICLTLKKEQKKERVNGISGDWEIRSNGTSPVFPNRCNRKHNICSVLTRACLAPVLSRLSALQTGQCRVWQAPDEVSVATLITAVTHRVFTPPGGRKIKRKVSKIYFNILPFPLQRRASVLMPIWLLVWFV